MMTPAQLKNYEFKTAGRNAYKADDVDIFLAEVVANYEKMFRENSELIKRINLLATKLESYQNDEADIKQAVLSAQRAADLIIKEAENSVVDSKSEAEAILAAAKGEADIIKSDAEKQAIADSELVLALATDKAEDIINKAKEKAHDILIEANASASDTVGQANRTITSESLHYDMLKKEVSEFRASVLAQYKAHIELISKLPELAVEEAKKIECTASDDEQQDESVYCEDETSLDELDAEINSVIDEEDDVISEEDDVIEYITDEEIDDESVIQISDETQEQLIEDNGEVVVKTTLPYDFFEEDTSLEFVESEEEEEPVSEIDAFENYVGIEFGEDEETEILSNAISADNFSVDVKDLDLSLFEADNQSQDEDVAEIPTHIIVDDEENDDDDVSDFFDSIETVDTIEDAPADDKPKGLFSRFKK